MKYISDRIDKRMKELGILQTELGKLSGVAQSTINRLLNTPIKSRIDTIQKVASALKLPPEYLIIKDETKANLCRKIYDMNQDEIIDTIRHIEKEQFLKEHYQKHG